MQAQRITLFDQRRIAGRGFGVQKLHIADNALFDRSVTVLQVPSQRFTKQQLVAQLCVDEPLQQFGVHAASCEASVILHHCRQALCIGRAQHGFGFGEQLRSSEE